MAEHWKGAPVAQALTERLIVKANQLKVQGIVPTLAIVRVGERPEDLSYERGALKRCEKVGIRVRQFTLPEESSHGDLMALIEQINADREIHGCLLFRPLPPQIDEAAICAALDPAKDVDGITAGSLASVFTGGGAGYPPCTAQACMEILNYYGCDLTGKRAVVVGRSLVVGKPLSMLLLGKNATVTLCHTRTADLAVECRRAEVLIAAAGRANMIGRDHLAPGQLVLDVGINVDENGNLVGDVDFAAADEIVGAVTPVPGGVGAVTTSVLAAHVLQAAEQAR
ncbi:bifunctional 5,10-methylenetetrahydrofolate dehydrogenase/5,10-methenyltetrahydrofolate cyclohydrolase [Flavonifractor sp. An112]|uniref:bifunctional 5,10-methylenetetrahydrofolate dehydrogenase/5,10-methenyltetrahydrofolate cyclohydrolase n=1 Tax=Flavonifractor sp. An112 TaxID=1965544 RepID=UPI001749A407|nr:bifunctional 5,10-methylenetetrahydrofolate dehydrogenase/5,10-methenyltetrahydrofolate cyclohydrolase [Flavonifractor sp. An112]HIZ94712.1 bifunctional 5,10-methylenetetrahydrofolate dehydrogenase/5,10-methenyltetrahydrofolate cyclohydrolase [Candidatus Flavonifractor avicola]